MTRATISVLLAIYQFSPLALRAQPAFKSTDERLTKARFIGIPLVNYNRNFKFIFGGFGGFYHPINTADTISPPSFTGLGAIYTTNGTGALAGFSRMYLLEDFLRINVAGGVGKVNFQYFNEDFGLDGGFVNYTSTAAFFVASPLFQLAGGWYLGPEYSYLNVATEFQDVPATNERRTYVSLGVAGEFDTRLSKTYPLNGLYCTIRIRRYADWLGSATEYTKLKIEVNRYLSLDSISILALRGSIHAALGTVPFEAQTVVGQGKDIRGYSNGKYRGDQVYSIQGEYRWNFKPPFGAVGFIGFALPVTQGEAVTLNGVLPGIGVGFRYMMIPEIHANVGIDVAVGREDWGLYFRIAEAF